jgi:hypothetical protein
MKRFLITAGILVAYSVVAPFAFCAEDDEDTGPTLYDKTYEVKVTEFEAQVIETDHFLINNVMLSRVRNEYGDDKLMERIQFGASLKGKTTKSQEVTVMLAGYDEKKTLLWTAASTDSMYGKSIGAMNDQVKVPQGTFKSTVNVWMRVIAVTSGR